MRKLWERKVRLSGDAKAAGEGEVPARKERCVRFGDPRHSQRLLAQAWWKSRGRRRNMDAVGVASRRRAEERVRSPPTSSRRSGFQSRCALHKPVVFGSDALNPPPSEAPAAVLARVDESFNIRLGRTNSNHSGLDGESGSREARSETWRRGRASKQGRRRVVTTEADVNRHQSIAFW